MNDIKLTADDVHALFEKDFPEMDFPLRITELTEKGAIVSFTPESRHLRPGGTVSGPSLFALADLAAYATLLTRIGAVTLAVTTSAQIDFMRKPQAGEPILADVKLLKIGRALAVVHIEMHNPDSDKVLVQCSLTYSIPPAHAPKREEGARS